MSLNKIITIQFCIAALGLEESVDLSNYKLFEELADIEYNPPLVSNELVSAASEVPVNQNATSVLTTASNSVVLCQPHLVRVPTPTGNISVSLASEYNSIMESLPKQEQPMVQFAGIPTTILPDNILVPVEISTASVDAAFGAQEPESMELDNIIVADDMKFVDENALFSFEEIPQDLVSELGLTSSSASTAGVEPKMITITFDDLDLQMDRAENTLDALLKGDVSQAYSHISETSNVYSPVTDAASVSSCSDDEDTSESFADRAIITTTKKQPSTAAVPSKPERR